MRDSKHNPADDLPDSVYGAWLASRKVPGQEGTLLVPGAQRQLDADNTRLALFVTRHCSYTFLKSLWSLNPLRTTLMVSLNIARSLFPAIRGYSQALIVDELYALIASDSFTWSRLLCLIFMEVFRRGLEGSLDTIAASNERVVLESARFFIEYKQMEHRVRLDVPTLADPVIRDLLQESELFSRSFSGTGFGFLSPLDFLQIISLITEILSHVFLIISLTHATSHCGVLALSILSALFPTLISWYNVPRAPPDSRTTTKEARAADRLEKMRNLAYSDSYRPEIALFGLGEWILKSWSSARKVILEAEESQPYHTSPFAQCNLTELIYAVQNIPLLFLLKESSVCLGSLTVYRSSIQSIVYASRGLVTTTQMAFQGIFLMSAFCASLELKPRLQPKDQDTVEYEQKSGGVTIDVKGLFYTYPGTTEPALRDVNLSLGAGETLAIVGLNGSGKSTLANVLLRILDFDKGSLNVNGVDIRSYDPSDYHKHISAVFQGFSKFNSTVKENVGLGNVDKIGYRPAITRAVHLAEADRLVSALPKGVNTVLETPGFDSISYPGMMDFNHQQRHGLSGGEWQRIAIARAFMRATEPSVDLLVFDEPTSSLDAHAQTQIFDTITKTSKTPTGERLKTVIFITHRLSTARRADKVAMMENGTITEFGSHEELLARNGSYASLYRASI
ncbi:P-loop containing nucleoside triphosphate hydrolase protein [Macrolepiota fuliginosa MF-IS2]|uniref:P-loop containing nucleoside triphosphate hydrolase protein n=1 Tax=Macrolepiota fuliginosa MF-IS2 TaxID=1400762 RepID=A0A9P6C4S5_9AGAR|nr:P-loop containing nucleoside triphosphate hydrolase protein [Macrolepiota fuliginosa MF-IS2]